MGGSNGVGVFTGLTLLKSNQRDVVVLGDISGEFFYRVTDTFYYCGGTLRSGIDECFVEAIHSKFLSMNVGGLVDPIGV